jgi:hypothetical protein
VLRQTKIKNLRVAISRESNLLSLVSLFNHPLLEVGSIVYSWTAAMKQSGMKDFGSLQKLYKMRNLVFFCQEFSGPIW